MADETAIAEQLRELTDEIDSKNKWDNPWYWHNPHRCVDKLSAGSDYDIGTDNHNNVLIHHNGYVACLNSNTLRGLLNDQ